MKMRALLGNLGLEDALEAKKPMLETLIEVQKKEIRDRRKETDKRAFKTLILSLGDKVLQEVSKMTIAEELWNRFRCTLHD